MASKKLTDLILTYPDHYIDPRDFHEAVMKTCLEANKLPLPKIAKKHKSKPGIGFFARQNNAMDIRFLSAYLHILMQGCDGLCIIDIDYSKDFFKRNQLTGVQFSTEYAKTDTQDATHINGFVKGKKITANNKTPIVKLEKLGDVITIAQMLQDTPITVLHVGAAKPKSMSDLSSEFLKIDEVMTVINKELNYALLIVGDQEQEFDSPYNASRVFQTLATMLERTIKTISCDSSVGELHLFIG